MNETFNERYSNFRRFHNCTILQGSQSDWKTWKRGKVFSRKKKQTEKTLEIYWENEKNTRKVGDFCQSGKLVLLIAIAATLLIYSCRKLNKPFFLKKKRTKLKISHDSFLLTF